MKNKLRNTVLLLSAVLSSGASAATLLYKCSLESASANDTRGSERLFVFRADDGKVVISHTPIFPQNVRDVSDCRRQSTRHESIRCSENNDKIEIYETGAAQSPAYRNRLVLNKRSLVLTSQLYNRHLHSFLYRLTSSERYRCEE